MNNTDTIYEPNTTRDWAAQSDENLETCIDLNTRVAKRTRGAKREHALDNVRAARVEQYIREEAATGRVFTVIRGEMSR